MNRLCDSCETVNHCSRHGCIPLEPADDPLTTPGEAIDWTYYASIALIVICFGVICAAPLIFR